MISEYVLQELEKLFPDCYVSFKYSRGSFEVSIKEPSPYWSINDFTVLEYDSRDREIKVLKPVDTDTLQNAISLLSLVKNVKSEEVKDNE